MMFHRDSDMTELLSDTLRGNDTGGNVCFRKAAAEKG